MSFQRTSIFLNADDRKIVSALQKRYGLSTMSETIRFALRIATAFPPKTSQRTVPVGLNKPDLIPGLISKVKHINQRVEKRVRDNEILLAQRHAHLKALSTTQGTS